MAPLIVYRIDNAPPQPPASARRARDHPVGIPLRMLGGHLLADVSIIIITCLPQFSQQLSPAAFCAQHCNCVRINSRDYLRNESTHMTASWSGGILPPSRKLPPVYPYFSLCIPMYPYLSLIIRDNPMFALQITGITRDYKGLQGITRDYQGGFPCLIL